MRHVGILVLGLMLAGTAAPGAYAQQGERPPANGNRAGDKKNPPGPIVREEKRGDNNNRGGGDKRGGEKPPKPRP